MRPRRSNGDKPVRAIRCSTAYHQVLSAALAPLDRSGSGDEVRAILTGNNIDTIRIQEIVGTVKDSVRPLHISGDGSWTAALQCLTGLFQLKFVGPLECPVNRGAIDLP